MTGAVLAGCVLGAYLLGSIPVGYLLSKRKGVDVRTVGSGNIGASNVARSVGKGLGALVLLLDLAKGALAVLGLTWLVPAQYVHWTSLPAVGLAAILGHCFPVWLRFRGGKGVATALGVFLVVAPAPTGVIAIVWLLCFTLTRVASIGSMTACLALPFILFWFHYPREVVVLGILAAALILARHHGNIRRLLKRSELKV